jgi:hypothetical protein
MEKRLSHPRISNYFYGQNKGRIKNEWFNNQGGGFWNYFHEMA